MGEIQQTFDHGRARLTHGKPSDQDGDLSRIRYGQHFQGLHTYDDSFPRSTSQGRSTFTAGNSICSIGQIAVPSVSGRMGGEEMELTREGVNKLGSCYGGKGLGKDSILLLVKTRKKVNGKWIVWMRITDIEEFEVVDDGKGWRIEWKREGR